MKPQVLAMAAITCLACERQTPVDAAETVESWSFTPGHVEVPTLPAISDRVAVSGAADEALAEVFGLGEAFGAEESYDVVAIPAWESPEYAERLVHLIVAYPESTSALTARFELAAILARSADAHTRQRRLDLYRELASAHPSRWQGVLAREIVLADRIQRNVRLVLSIPDEIDELAIALKKLESSLPEDYVRWATHRYARPRTNLCASFYFRTMHAALRSNEPEIAQLLGKRVLDEYPDSGHAPQTRTILDELAHGRNPYFRPPMKY